MYAARGSRTDAATLFTWNVTFSCLPTSLSTSRPSSCTLVPQLVIQQLVLARQVQLRIVRIGLAVHLQQPTVLEALRCPVHGVHRPADALGQALPCGDIRRDAVQIHVARVRAFPGLDIHKGRDGGVQGLVRGVDAAIPGELEIELHPVQTAASTSRSRAHRAHDVTPAVRRITERGLVGVTLAPDTVLTEILLSEGVGLVWCSGFGSRCCAWTAGWSCELSGRLRVSGPGVMPAK